MSVIDLLGDLLGPKWSHSNPEVRRASIEGLQDLNALRRLALEDSDYTVRRRATEAAGQSGSSQPLLLDIVRHGKDTDLVELAWGLLREQWVIARLVEETALIAPGLAKRAADKLIDPASEMLRLIAKRPSSPEWRNTLLNLIESRALRNAVIDRILGVRIAIERIGIIPAHKSLALWSDARTILGKTIDVTKKETLWQGAIGDLEVLKGWEQLEPLTEQEIQKLTHEFTSSEQVQTILDVLDNVERAALVHLVSGSKSTKGMRLVVSNEHVGPSGWAKATEEIEYLIASSGSGFYLFGCGRYLDV